MAELSFFNSEEIEKIRKLLGVSNLEVIVHSHWGSRSPQHRKKIHQDLKDRSSLAEGPVSSSISHCRALGGYALITFDSSEKLQIGFDIEEDARVTSQIARRICMTEEEFLAAPSSASLWTAKEAAYKSLKGPLQPPVVTDLEIIGWKQLESQFETASLKNHQFYSSTQIDGVLIKKSPFTFAFFVLRA